MTSFESKYPSEHSVEDIWRAINTPPPRDLAAVINPLFEVEYTGESQIGLGTLIIYIPRRIEHLRTLEE